MLMKYAIEHNLENTCLLVKMANGKSKYVEGYLSDDHSNKIKGLPDGVNAYEIRSDDKEEYATIEPKGKVDFSCTFLTTTNLTFPKNKDKYLEIDNSDLD